MRGLKSTLFLMVVLAGLAGYIYYTRDRPASGTETKAKAFEVLSENIEEVQVKGAAGEAARVQRVDANWKLVSPQPGDADATEVGAITSALASLEIQRVVDDNPSDLAQYGLNPPRIDLSFRVKDQKDSKGLLVGEKTATGGDLYAKTLDHNRVFLISSYLDTTFNKSAFDLRDKAILKFDREKADVMEIISGANTLQFTREGTNWRIAKPIAARADYSAAEGLVTRLSSGQMQRMVDAESTDLAKYGLDKPSIRALIGTGSARATLLVGLEDTDGQRFAKDEARPAVFTIDQSMVTELQKAANEYRSKDLFDFRSFSANRLELRRGSDTRTFEKTKAADGKDIWRSAGKDLDAAKVEDLLTKLSGLRAASFESSAHASLKAPVLTAVATFDDTKTETVTFGRAGSDVFAGRADEPGSARLEAGTTFDDAVKALDELK